MKPIICLSINNVKSTIKISQSKTKYLTQKHDLLFKVELIFLQQIIFKIPGGKKIPDVNKSYLGFMDFLLNSPETRYERERKVAAFQSEDNIDQISIMCKLPDVPLRFPVPAYIAF